MRTMIEGISPFPEEFGRRYREAGYWPGLTTWQALNESIQKHGPRTAIVGGETRLSYEDLGRQVDALASNLLDTGIKPEDRVVLHLPNVPEFLLIYFALARIGAVPVCCLPPHRRTEITYLAELAGAVAYVIPDQIRGFDY
ncbi:MAG: AMP-binding protein, partial [Chloroflexi bacterium]|nr:AMP-binding protein [Chloroflexota bacterium]